MRDFVTGKLLSTFLDMFTLIVLLPVLFYLSATLSWFVLGGSMCIAMIIFIFMPAMRRTIGRVIQAETQKNVVLVETVHGIKTVKSLALEPQQKRCLGPEGRASPVACGCRPGASPTGRTRW